MSLKDLLKTLKKYFIYYIPLGVAFGDENF